MYAGFVTNYFDLSLEPTQELFVTLVTLYSLFCHFGNLTQEHVLSLRWPSTKVYSVTSVIYYKSLFLIHLWGELKGQLSVQAYRTSYQSRSSGPVIGPDLQSQLSVQIFGARYRSRPTGPVIGPDLEGQLSAQIYKASGQSTPTGPVIGPRLQGQLSVQIYRASDRCISSGLVIGPFLHGQLSVHFFRASYRSNPVSLDNIGRFTSTNRCRIIIIIMYVLSNILLSNILVKILLIDQLLFSVLLLLFIITVILLVEPYYQNLKKNNL